MKADRLAQNGITLLAPAGGWEQLSAAIQNGAGAVYFGVGHLNMRSHATTNFRQEELPAIVEACHAAEVGAWLAVNIIVYDRELAEIDALLRAAKEAGVDAIIASDMAVITLAHSLGLPVHLSVQANLSNWRAIEFYAPYVDVVVAARELTCEALEELSRAIRDRNLRGPSGELVRLEAFVHTPSESPESRRPARPLVGPRRESWNPSGRGRWRRRRRCAP